jgi:hypothetical protein
MEQATQALKNAIEVSKTWEIGPDDDWYSRAEQRLQQYQQAQRSPE